MHHPLILILSLSGFLLHCRAPIPAIEEGARLATISLAEPQGLDFDQFHIRITGESTSRPTYENRLDREQAKAINQTQIPAGNYVFLLEYLKDRDLIASSEFCSSDLRNDKQTLNPGPNSVKISVCREDDKTVIETKPEPAFADVSISPEFIVKNQPHSVTTSVETENVLIDRNATINLRRLTLDSAAMKNANYGFNIYLPPTYEKTQNKRYPVIYSLHGAGGDENSNTWVISAHVHRWIIEGKIPEVIMVFPNGGKDSFFLDQNVIRQQAENPDTHLIKELIPFIDRNYRSDPKKRAITGFSMGGFGTYHFSFKYPELFAAAAPMAAGGPYGAQGLIREYNPAENPRQLIATNKEKLQKLRFAIAVGGDDLVEYNNEFSQLMRSQGVQHEYYVLAGVRHDFGAIMNQKGLEIFQLMTKGF